MLITRPTNHLGLPVNEAHLLHRFTDAQVARAHELRASGATLRAIAGDIGCHHTTALRWVTQRMRRPATAVRVVRVKTPSADQQSAVPLAESTACIDARSCSRKWTLESALSDAELEALRKQFGDIA